MKQPATGGNRAKYLSYKLAHERMKAAVAAGFPLEAVAIAESLITDRLLSFVNFHGADFDPERVTLGRVVPKLAKICREETMDPEGATLAVEVEKWAKERNSVLHSIAKSGQGVGPKVPAEAFVAHANAVARCGSCLVKWVKEWHRKQVQKTLRANKSGVG